MSTPYVGIEIARAKLGEITDHVRYRNEPYVLTRNGTPAAAIVPMGVYEKEYEMKGTPSGTAMMYRASVFLTGDLELAFTVVDRQASQVPEEAWEAFAAGYRHAHGAEPASTLTEYVVENSAWSWDTTYGEGAVVVGDTDGPLTLEPEADGPEGCRIVFWHEGSVYDTGLRVWEPEAALLAQMLRDKAGRDGT